MNHKLLLLIPLFLTLTACGRKADVDLTTTLSETRGLQPGADVVWKGQVVGEVISVTPANGGLNVEVDLVEKFETAFHQGLASSAVGHSSSPERSTLNLYGGTDTTQPVLTAGSQIPEALPHQKVNQTQVIWIVGIMAAIVVIVLAIKSIGFIIKLAVTLLLVAGSFFYLKVVLEKHGSDLVPESVAAKVDQFMATHEVSDHLDAWLAQVKEDARAVADEAARLGKEHGKSFTNEVIRRTEEKIKEVGAESEAGRELRELADKLEAIDE